MAAELRAQRTVVRAALLFAGIGLSLQLWRLWSLNATYDQGLFLQEIWNGYLGKPFESTLASELSTPVLVTKEALPTLGYHPVSYTHLTLPTKA